MAASHASWRTGLVPGLLVARVHGGGLGRLGCFGTPDSCRVRGLDGIYAPE